MKDVLTYKGFTGTVHFSAEDNVFHGKIEGIDDLVIFEGHSVEELIKAFHNAADDYAALSNEMGKVPIKSSRGSFNVRIPPEMHRKAAERAIQKGLSLNQLVQTAIEKELVHN